MTERIYTDDALIAALQGNAANRNSALQWICKNEKWRKSVVKVVAQLGGDDRDAEDVFQEGIAAFVKNVMQKKFKGESQPLTYFVGICRFRYLKKYSKKPVALNIENHTGQQEMPSTESQIIRRERTEEQKVVMRKVMSQLKENCQKILKMYSLKYPMEEIAREMGFDNTQSAKNKARDCRERLRKLIVDNQALYAKIKSWL